MSRQYVEEYAKNRGITVAEAMQHAVVKEYLKYHPLDKEEEYKLSKTKLVAGCGCMSEE